MAQPDVVLKFEIVDGLTPNAENIAHALLAWVDLMKAAADVIDPAAELRVGLYGVEDGSDIFKFSLDRLERFSEQATRGSSKYPLVSRATITLAGAIFLTAVGSVVNVALTPDPKMPEDQRDLMVEQNRLLAESIEVTRERERFYQRLLEERAISSIDVTSDEGLVIYHIPREEFAERSGLWTGEEVDELRDEETRTVVWDVVLIRPVLIASPRRWQFARDGLEFSALMEDRTFLDAIHSKTLAVPLSEGIRMRIEVKFKERYDGGQWVAIKGSHRVSQVLDPLPPPPSSPLFPRAG